MGMRRARLTLSKISAGAGGPDERIGALVVVIDVVSDRGDEFFDIAKDAGAQSVLNQIPKEALRPVLYVATAKSLKHEIDI